MASLPTSVADALTLPAKGRYVADRSLATAVYLSLSLKRPLFLEGEAGTGKTEVAKAPAELSRQVVAFVQKLRAAGDLFKLPGIAETIDWAHALSQLDVLALTPEAINDTLGVLLKYQDDIAKIQGSEAERLLAQVKAELAAAQ